MQTHVNLVDSPLPRFLYLDSYVAICAEPRFGFAYSPGLLRRTDENLRREPSGGLRIKQKYNLCETHFFGIIFWRLLVGQAVSVFSD